jgi:hypothetical protein
MNTHEFNAVNDELERLDCMLKASENWSDLYARDEKTHAALIRAEAKLEKNLRAYFRGLSEKAYRYVNWSEYARVKAYDIDVIVTDTEDDVDSQEFITVTFDPLLSATAVGALAGETIYQIPLGIQGSDAAIQQLTTKQIAFLVGKKINKEGQIIDNPNAKYNITETTRNNIKKSIQTSIQLGENQEEATGRLSSMLKNPKRAALIAQTEAVNAYSNGMLEFGQQSMATGKEAQDVGAIDVCLEYSAEGIVPLNHLYGGQYNGPSFHGRCRCGLRLVYKNEFDPNK